MNGYGTVLHKIYKQDSFNFSEKQRDIQYDTFLKHLMTYVSHWNSIQRVICYNFCARHSTKRIFELGGYINIFGVSAKIVAHCSIIRYFKLHHEYNRKTGKIHLWSKVKKTMFFTVGFFFIFVSVLLFWIIKENIKGTILVFHPNVLLFSIKQRLSDNVSLVVRSTLKFWRWEVPWSSTNITRHKLVLIETFAVLKFCSKNFTSIDTTIQMSSTV